MATEANSPDAFARRTLDFVRVSSEVFKRAQTQQAEKSAADAAIAAEIPAVIDALVAGDRIFENQKEAVAKAIADPMEALRLLKDVAGHRNQSEVDAIGAPAGQTKSASDNGNGHAHYRGGRVADYDETEAGRRFKQRILGGV